jgi:hypothetical protein
MFALNIGLSFCTWQLIAPYYTPLPRRIPGNSLRAKHASYVHRYIWSTFFSSQSFQGISIHRCMGNALFSSVVDINNDEKETGNIRKKRSFLVTLFCWWFPVVFASSSAMIYRWYDLRVCCFRLPIKEHWVESEVLQVLLIGRWSTSNWKLKYFGLEVLCRVFFVGWSTSDWKLKYF